MNNSDIQNEIAEVLRKIGSKKRLERARMLESPSSTSNIFHFRNLDLNSSEVISIANCLKQKGENKTNFIKSISFSYNALLGDLGVIALVENLPKSLNEIGLVNCGISDAGGIELLNWMKKSPSLKMVCIEHNNFSNKLKMELKKFNEDNPQILLVF